MLGKQVNVKRVLTGTPQVDGNKVTAPATLTNNIFDLWGVGPVQFSTEAVVEGGKIKSYASLISPAEQGRAAAAAKAYAAVHPAQSAPPAQTAGMPRTGDTGDTAGGGFVLADGGRVGSTQTAQRIRRVGRIGGIGGWARPSLLHKSYPVHPAPLRVGQPKSSSYAPQLLIRYIASK